MRIFVTKQINEFLTEQNKNNICINIRNGFDCSNEYVIMHYLRFEEIFQRIIKEYEQLFSQCNQSNCINVFDMMYANYEDFSIVILETLKTEYKRFLQIQEKNQQLEQKLSKLEKNIRL